MLPLLQVIISPILAGLAVGIGVPILLFYVYGVVPVSLCRSGGCGGSSTADDGNIITTTRNNTAADTTSIDAVSNRVTNPSIGEASLSMASGSQVMIIIYLQCVYVCVCNLLRVKVLRDVDRESASTVALAGSIGNAGHRLEVQADMESAQRLSISSLSDKSANISLADDGAASTRALAGSVFNYKVKSSN